MSSGRDRSPGDRRTDERLADERLADWVDGRLGGKEHERFEAELRVNPQLRADLAAYERTVASVRAALQAPTQHVQLADRVLAAIAAGERAPSAAGRLWRRGSMGWSLAAAAALLCLALLVDAWSQPAPEGELVARGDARPEAKAEGGAERDTYAELDQLLERAEAPKENASAPDAPPATTGAPKPAATGAPKYGGPGRDQDAGTEAARSEQQRAGAAQRGAPSPGQRETSPEPAPSAAPPADTGVEPSGDAALMQTTDVERARTDPREETAPEPTAGAELRLGMVRAEPLPLIVLHGPAPAAEQLFAVRARKQRAGVDERGMADGDRRVDEFLTAQVAQLGAGERPVDDARPDAAAAAWVQVANLRVQALVRAPPPPQGTGPAAPGTTSRERAGEHWIERDWLVEGSRADVAALLRRLATFAADTGLELRSGETTTAPRTEADGAGPEGQTKRAAENARLVLRFRLQTR